MRQQIIDCFDSNIQKRILQLNEKLKSIVPDNIRYLDSSVIEMNKKVDALNFMYSGDAMINSVDSYKLNTMIVKAKSRIMQFAAIARVTMPTDGDLSLPLVQYLHDNFKKNVQIIEKVPESFSGLRSFIVCVPDLRGEEDFPYYEDKKKFWYFKSEDYITFNFLRYSVSEIYILFWK